MTLSAEEYYDPEGGQQEPRTSQESGCRRLLVALLEDLFHCKEKRRTSQQAWAQYVADTLWVTSESTRPFGFIWTCVKLNLDPAAVRAKFLAP